MDALIRQLRAKYPNQEKEDRVNSSSTAVARDKQQLAPIRIQSFKGEKRISQSWLKRQFSRQMSQDYDSGTGGDYQIAVAAAAFAVKSIEETRISDRKKGHQIQETSSVTKFKKKEDDKARVPETRARSIKFSDEITQSNLDAEERKVRISLETSEKKPDGLVPALKKKLSFGDATASSPLKNASREEKTTGKAGGSVPVHKKKLSFGDTVASSPPEIASPEVETIGSLLPSVKKTPPFTDQSLDKTPSRKHEIREPKADFQPPKQPEIQPVDYTRQSPINPGAEEDTADTWEKAELARIKQKYEKLNIKVLEWENKQKKKEKRKLNKREAELDRRRAKALQHYRDELARIDGIAGGARSQAIENRKNEEFKAREKANKMRLTGKVPTTCLCC